MGNNSVLSTACKLTTRWASRVYAWTHTNNTSPLPLNNNLPTPTSFRPWCQWWDSIFECWPPATRRVPAPSCRMNQFVQLAVWRTRGAFDFPRDQWGRTARQIAVSHRNRSTLQTVHNKKNKKCGRENDHITWREIISAFWRYHDFQ